MSDDENKKKFKVDKQVRAVETTSEAINAAIRKTMVNWIDCNDRLPKLWEPVICWNECAKCRANVEHLHMCVENGFPHHGAFQCKLVERKGKIQWGTFYKANITHWMPMPKLLDFGDNILPGEERDD